MAQKYKIKIYMTLLNDDFGWRADVRKICWNPAMLKAEEVRYGYLPVGWYPSYLMPGGNIMFENGKGDYGHNLIVSHFTGDIYLELDKISKRGEKVFRIMPSKFGKDAVDLGSGVIPNPKSD